MMYKGIVKKRDTKKKVTLLLGGILILGMAVMQRNWLYIMMAVILILAIFFKKEHVVSEKGVSIEYELFGIKVSNKWEWDQITAIRPDFKKARPNILLEIAKDVTIRAFTFTEEDAWGVMELAKKMNPDAYVDDRTPEERREDADEYNRKLDEERMRAAKAKQEARAKSKAKAKAKSRAKKKHPNK